MTFLVYLGFRLGLSALFAFGLCFLLRRLLFILRKKEKENAGTKAFLAGIALFLLLMVLSSRPLFICPDEYQPYVDEEIQKRISFRTDVTAAIFPYYAIVVDYADEISVNAHADALPFLRIKVEYRYWGETYPPTVKGSISPFGIDG